MQKDYNAQDRKRETGLFVNSIATYPHHSPLMAIRGKDNLNEWGIYKITLLPTPFSFIYVKSRGGVNGIISLPHSLI